MSNNKKSTDPGLSAAERKELRDREAQEAIAEHEDAQKAFHENRERLRNERLVREAAEGPMVVPTPELPDDTLIERVLFPIRIRNALRAADLKTVGEVRRERSAGFGKSSLRSARNWVWRRPMELDPWAKSPPDLLQTAEGVKSARSTLRSARRFLQGAINWGDGLLEGGRGEGGAWLVDELYIETARPKRPHDQMQDFP